MIAHDLCVGQLVPSHLSSVGSGCLVKVLVRTGKVMPNRPGGSLEGVLVRYGRRIWLFVVNGYRYAWLYDGLKPADGLLLEDVAREEKEEGEGEDCSGG